MGYPDAIQCIRMLKISIQMPKRSIRIRWIQGLGCWSGGYPDTQGWYADAKNRIRIPKRGIRICWIGCWSAGYPDAEKSTQIHFEVIRILEESIRMPTIGRSRTATNRNKNLKQNYFNLVIVLGNQNRKHYASVTDLIKWIDWKEIWNMLKMWNTKLI